MSAASVAEVVTAACCGKAVAWYGEEVAGLLADDTAVIVHTIPITCVQSTKQSRRS